MRGEAGARRAPGEGLSALALLAILLSMLPWNAARAAAVSTSHVSAELIAEHTALAPGENWVALRLAPEPGWHTYYADPGDVGLPTKLKWSLPAGFAAGDIRWPEPETFRADELVSYGYSRETLHLVPISVPASAAGQNATLTAQASWLVCMDICIPEKASLTLTLPVRAAPGGPSPWAAAFAATRSHLSQPGSAAREFPSPDPKDDGGPVATTSLGLVLAFALLGGLILNLMPCVFPVLSIKAVSLMETHGKERHHQRGHALAYTAGVVLSTLTAATAILLLRAMGQALGWGFQLQSPVFVAVIAYLLFALGLSMSGVVQFGTSIMGVGQSLAVRDGYAGSFFTGVLAVVVASPCTAPFMGTALGYALVQPAAVALLVFTALGLGLALPFLLIGFVPALARLLPRPGHWMETFKQAMAFPLYLTVAWLAWVLARQTGVNAVPVLLSGLVLVALACWLMARHGLVSRGVRYAALVGAVGLLFVPALHQHAAAASAPADASAQDARWEPYTDARLTELRAQGRPVFVNLTADWCLTCKFNERVALDTDAVRDALEQHHVAALKGDWTRADPAITRVLERFHRAGVPLYLLYGAGDEPVVLPQLLTRDTVLAAIDQLP